MAATLLIRLGKLCGRADYLAAAQDTLEAATQLMNQSPTAAGQLLIALDMQLGPFSEIVLVGDPNSPETAEVLSDLRGRYVSNRVIACRAQGNNPDGSIHVDPIFVGKQSLDPAPTVYVCEKFACAAPVRGKQAAKTLWEKLAGAVAVKKENA